MHFAFDLNGTVDRFTEPFKAIMGSLVAAGHRVTILTGAIRGSGNSLLTSRTSEVARLGLEQDRHYNAIVIATSDSVGGVAEEKARWCMINHVAMLWEDTLLYADTCTRRYPEMATYLLMVTPVERYRP